MMYMRSVERSMITFWPRQLPHGPRGPPGQPGACSIGDLEVFPHEILEFILKNLNFRTLGEVRLVNKKGKCVVDNLREYKHMMDYAPGVIHALTLTRTAPFFSADHLSMLLFDERCRTCDDFGPYMFLPLAWRCCYFCLYTDPRYRIISLSAATCEFGLQKWHIYGRYPILETIYGEYNEYHGRINGDGDEYYGIRSRGNPFSGGPGVEIVSAQQMRVLVYGISEMEKRPWVSLHGQIANGPGPTSGITRGELPLRGMAAIPFPYLNPKTRVLEHGTLCEGCATLRVLVPLTTQAQWYHSAKMKRRERSFSEAGFLAHIEECPRMESIWRSDVDDEIRHCVRASAISFRENEIA